MYPEITVESVTFYAPEKSWSLEMFTTSGGAGRGEELFISKAQAKELIETFNFECDHKGDEIERYTR